MKVSPRIRGAFRITYGLLLLGAALAWLSKSHPGPAVIALVCVYAAAALLAGPVGRKIGLPAFRADEAYADTLRRWRQERRHP